MINRTAARLAVRVERAQPGIGRHAPAHIRASAEGVNDCLEGRHTDLGNPVNRLTHGRVAQTLLVTLIGTEDGPG
ncbi:hypothetical protein [Streptosporangium sp. NPDC000396]|uniref:hypothetical protein n=1 Tax=Streptosporangium sp. NPDC000396 TaxID=3366185 RepID=UPI0036AA5DA7